jgi:signal transduction histidine kinase
MQRSILAGMPSRIPAETVADTAEQLRKIQTIADAALAHLTLVDLLDELLDRVREILGADTCAILLLDEATNELVARAARGIEEEVEQGVRIPVGMGFAGRVAALRQPVAIEDVDHADVLNPILREKGLKSLLGVPLLVHGDVIGVLHVGTLTHREFTRDDVDLLQLAAERAALAIEHGRVYEAERAVAQRLRKLQSVTDAALQHLVLDELLDELLVRVRDMLEADTCAILLLDERHNELVARAARGIEEEVEQGVRIPVGGGFAGRIAAERRPIMLAKVDHTNVLNPILREKGIKSLLGAPLLARGRVLGVIHVGSLTPRVFSNDDVELLQLAAERAALGLERALVHDELIRYDRVRHNFVSIASHELRTPASSILGAAVTLVHRSDSLDDEQKRKLQQILAEQAQRLATLIDQLLDLSRLEAHAVQIHPKRLGVREHIEKTLAEIAFEPRSTIAIDVPGSLEVDADPIVVERVVSNLAINAIRHGRPPVTISAELDGRYLHLTVADAGPGIPADLRPRLFEEFARGPDAADRPGAGLGLAIARSYARAHGGDLLYEQPAGGGARFELVVPVASD